MTPPFDNGLSARAAGRWIGALTLLQMALAIAANFLIEAPSVDAAGLALAATQGAALATAALLAIAASLLSLPMLLLGWPWFSRGGPGLALATLALSTTVLALMVVEQSAVLSLVSIGQRFTQADAMVQNALAAAAQGAGALRNRLHYFGLLLAGAGLVLNALLLWRRQLVPRPLAAFSLVTALLQMVAVGMPLFGAPIRFVLLAPLALSQLMLAVWLLARGLRDDSAGAGASGP